MRLMPAILMLACAAPALAAESSYTKVCLLYTSDAADE